jgi:glucokinase
MDQQLLYSFSKPLLNGLEPVFSELQRVLVANRSDMGAWGEFRYGRGASMRLDDLVFLSVGGILGAGIIINRALVLGKFGFAGQFGHMLVDPGSTVECGMCHRKGCLSALVGGSAILGRLEARRQEQGGQHLLEYLGRNRTGDDEDAGQVRKIGNVTVDARAVINAADPAESHASPAAIGLAQKIMDDVAEPLGAAIGQVVCLLDPSVVVLGGIFSNASYLEEKLDETARKYVPHFRRGHNQLVFTEFSDHAEKVPHLRADETAIYGMAHWVWNSDA